MELSLAVPVSMVTEKNQRTIQYTIHHTYRKRLFLDLPKSTFFLLGRIGANLLFDSTELLFFNSNYYNQQSFYISDVKYLWINCLRSRKNVSSIYDFLHDTQEDSTIFQKVTSMQGSSYLETTLKQKQTAIQLWDVGCNCARRGVCYREAAAQRKENRLCIEIQTWV